MRRISDHRQRRSMTHGRFRELLHGLPKLPQHGGNQRDSLISSISPERRLDSMMYLIKGKKLENTM